MAIVTLRVENNADEKILNDAKVFFNETAATKTIMRSLELAPTYYKELQEAKKKILELEELLIKARDVLGASEAARQSVEDLRGELEDVEFQY